MTGLSGHLWLEAAQRPDPHEGPRAATGRNRRRLTGRGWAVLWAMAAVWSMVSFSAGAEQLFNPAGMSLLAEFWRAAVHPDLSGSFVQATAEAALTTVAFAVLGTGLSIAAGAALAMFMSQTWWIPRADTRTARTVASTGLVLTRATVGFPRGIHEAVWGLLLVSVLGRDPLVGVLAIAIPFGAITAKVYSEIIDETDHGPYDALRAAGAGRFLSLWYGIIPAALPALTSYAFTASSVPCGLRSSWA